MVRPRPRWIISRTRCGREARGQIKVTVIKPTGVIDTGLSGTVVNKAAGAPIVGHNIADFYAAYGKIAAGNPGELKDPDSIAHAFLAPDSIADAVVYAIAQPWGGVDQRYHSTGIGRPLHQLMPHLMAAFMCNGALHCSSREF